MSVRAPGAVRWALLAFALLVMIADVHAINGTRPARASPVSVTASAPAASSAARCARWRVKWRKAPVYEKPARIYHKVAVKRRKQVVTGALCTRLTYYNKREGVRYLALKARKAEDKIGWIRLAAVRRIR